MKVYVVTEGAYSDYDVVAIFSTMENAEKYQAAHRKNTNADILEYEVDPCVTECEVYYGLKVNIFRTEYRRCELIRDTKPIQESLDVNCYAPPHKLFITPVAKYYDNNSKDAQKIAQDAWAKYKYEHNITK